MYLSKSSLSCLRFIFCGTTAIDAREELEELEEERDLISVRFGSVLERYCTKLEISTKTSVSEGRGDC